MTAAEDLTDVLLPVAVELVGTVRDYGPDAVARVLADMPDLPDDLVGRTGGKYGALAVVLAAMVDPDATVAELLAWTVAGPVPSRPFAPVVFHPDRRSEPCPDCGRPVRVAGMARHRRTHSPALAVDRRAS